MFMIIKQTKYVTCRQVKEAVFCCLNVSCMIHGVADWRKILAAVSDETLEVALSTKLAAVFWVCVAGPAQILSES